MYFIHFFVKNDLLHGKIILQLPMSRFPLFEVPENLLFCHTKIHTVSLGLHVHVQLTKIKDCPIIASNEIQRVLCKMLNVFYAVKNINETL